MTLSHTEKDREKGRKRNRERVRERKMNLLRKEIECNERRES